MLAHKDSGGGVFSLYLFPMAHSQFSAYIIGRYRAGGFFALVQWQETSNSSGTGSWAQDCFLPSPRDRDIFFCPSRNSASVLLQVPAITTPPQSLSLLRERSKQRSMASFLPTVVADSLFHAYSTEGVFSSLFPCLQYFL